MKSWLSRYESIVCESFCPKRAINYLTEKTAFTRNNHSTANMILTALQHRLLLFTHPSPSPQLAVIGQLATQFITSLIGGPSASTLPELARFPDTTANIDEQSSGAKIPGLLKLPTELHLQIMSYLIPNDRPGKDHGWKRGATQLPGDHSSRVQKPLKFLKISRVLAGLS